MTDNKLFELTNKLTGVEKRELSKYLQSPYFNQRKDVLDFWEYILAQKGKNIDPEAAFAQIYNPSAWDAAQWRHLQTFLQQHVEQFLALRAAEAMPLFADMHLIPIFRSKNLQKPLAYVLRRTSDVLSRLPRDLEYYYQLYRLESEKYASTESQSRSRQTNLAAINQAFDVYACATKLRLACLMESHKNVYNTVYNSDLLQAMLPVIAHSDLKNVPIVSLYYHCYLSLTQGDEAHFKQFRNEIEALPAHFPGEERRIFLLLAINYCIRRLNDGNVAYAQEAFDFYKIGVETKALFENGFIGRFGFKNIVALGLKLQHHAWVEQFIEEYSPFLEEKHRHAQRDYNLAKLYYALRQYEKAMPLLARVDEHDLLLNFDSRILLMKMYYETSAWDSLDALFSSFKILLIRKKKILGYHHTHYQNALKYIQKLTKINFMNKIEVAKLREEVRATKGLMEQAWILERLAE